MRLSLQRVGWDMTGPFTFVDDLGIVRHVTDSPPAMMEKLLRQSDVRQLERKLAKAFQGPGFDGDRVGVDHIRALCKPASRKLDAREKGILRAVVCNATWTCSRARQAGYDVQDVCALCQKEGDTIFHRVWECEGSREVREASRHVGRRLPWLAGLAQGQPCTRRAS